MNVTHLTRTIFTLAVVVMTSLTAVAQDDQGGNGDRGGRGGRGFGGGFGGGGFGGGGFGGPMGGRGMGMAPGSVMGLLMIDEVRQELKLDDAQAEAIKELGKRLREESGGREDLRDFRNMSEADRAAAMTKMQARLEKMDTKAKEGLQEVLDPDQHDRLEQLSLQQRGVSALTVQSVAQELGITDDQQAQLKKVTESMGGRMQEVIGKIRESGDWQKMREEMGKIQEEIKSEMLAVLTDQQKTKFEEMKGEAFTFPERPFGGPGGFGPGGRGGDRGPRGDRGERGERGDRGPRGDRGE